MPRLIPRRRAHLRCHYCGDASRNPHPGTLPRSFLCPHCEAVNHLDEYGDITDPPVQATAPALNLQYARSSRSPTPVMTPAESPFCDTCQRNQMLVQNMMAEYIPDDDDPQYNKYVASADSYRAELEQRYPQVCDSCIGPVREQIRAAGYAAKADHFRRILELSKKNAANFYTRRQVWTLRVISLAKWTYLLSILIGLVWHTFGVMVASDSYAQSDEFFSWNVCVSQAFTTRQVEQWCFNSPLVRSLVQRAIIADLLTIWWNPKLEQKTVRFGGRMRRLVSLWTMRIAVIGVRYTSLHYRQEDFLGNDDVLQFLNLQHGVMLVVLVLSALVTWNTVRIEYQSTASFMKPIEPHLPSAPNSAPGSAEKQRQYQPVRPDHSTFDTMAQSFTSSFPIGKLGESTQRGLPPSPTLSTTSTRSYATNLSTPYMRRSIKEEDDDMEWTPTIKKFSTQTPEILPPMFGKPPSEPASPAPKQPHSIFSKSDPNPFRHKVPAAPRPTIRQDPWKAGVWAPALPESKENFFKKMMDSQVSPTTRENLTNTTVPKNVKRDAELFRQPQLKYDNYGTPKVTGLEDTFNDLFSK